jgi:hypothetical protein
MSNFVFVLDTNCQPLNPIPPGQARRLLKQCKAAVYRRYPFLLPVVNAIKLKVLAISEIFFLASRKYYPVY